MRLFDFRKKQPIDTVAPLAEQEYVAARKQRRGIALLIGVVTFTVAGLLAIMLFFGGRWVYRTANLQKVTRPISEQLTAAKAGSVQDRKDTAVAPSQDGSNNQPSTPPPASPQTPTTPTPESQTPSTSNNGPSTNPAPSTNIPNTGPSGAVSLFIMTSLGAASFYQLRLRRRGKLSA